MKNWSEAEHRAAIAAYLRLLRVQLAGGDIQKAAVRRELRAGPLSQRTEASIEYRMQNLSYVLDQHALPWVQGYRPRTHVSPDQSSMMWEIIMEVAPDLTERRAIAFIRPALRWEKRKKGVASELLPNIADTGSEASIAISSALYDSLSIPRTEVTTKVGAGAQLETGVSDYLAMRLPELDARDWIVSKPGAEMTASGQYSHYEAVRQLVQDDEILRAAIGFDYLVKPDVTVQLARRFKSAGPLHPEPDAPLLHACVSCKWTLRSDRAQNVRTEAAALIRHRGGRLPHIVVVTAEPTAGRIASIARGTGDIDAVFHIALPELKQAMRATGVDKQADQLSDLEAQGRLYDLEVLAEILAE